MLWKCKEKRLILLPFHSNLLYIIFVDPPDVHQKECAMNTKFMTYKFMFILNASVALVVGLGFLFKPDFGLTFLGVTEQYRATMWASRFFGSAMFALGVVLWIIKDVEEKVQKKLSWVMLVSSLLGLVLTVLASRTSTAVLRENSGFPIVIFVLFALGYVFMLFIKPIMKE
jgi:hypothetical protein